jgi:hypothetical protein
MACHELFKPKECSIMKISPLGMIVLIAALTMILVSIITMPETALFSFVACPMVIPRGSMLLERAAAALTVEEQPVSQVIPAEVRESGS